MIRFSPRLLILSALLPLAACATPEAQLRAGLIDAGLPPDLSGCMAGDMAPRLSTTQLLRLRDLSRAAKADPMRTSADAYLHQVRALNDGDIWIVTSRAAARCALGL